MDKPPLFLGLGKLSALGEFAATVPNVAGIPKSVEKPADFSIVTEAFNLTEYERFQISAPAGQR